MKRPFQILGVDHVAIAVKELDPSSRLWSSLLQGVDPHTERVAGERVDVAMYPLPDTKIELVAPFGDDSPIAKFLEKKGEGIHHICLRVDDAQAAWDAFVADGVPVLGNGPHDGAEGSKIFFLHPRAASGVLIEFRESRS